MRFRIGMALVAACVLAAPAAAQQRAEIKLNLSPAGQAVAKTYLGTPDPQIQALAKRGAEVMQRQKALIAAPKLDLVQFAALMRQREQVQSQLARRSNDRMLQMLRELSEADRVAFLRGISNPTLAPAPAAK